LRGDRRRRHIGRARPVPMPGRRRLYQVAVGCGGRSGGRADGRGTDSDVGLLAVTRRPLNAADRGAERARARARSRALEIRKAMAKFRPLRDRHVLDGNPATLAWLGAVRVPSRCARRRRAFRADGSDHRALSAHGHRRQAIVAARRADAAGRSAPQSAAVGLKQTRSSSDTRASSEKPYDPFRWRQTHPH